MIRNLFVVGVVVCLLSCPSCRKGGEKEGGGGDGSSADAKGAGKGTAPEEEGWLLDAGAGQAVELPGGIKVCALSLEEGASSSGPVRLKLGAVEKLPVELGGLLRLSPEIEIVGEADPQVLLVADIPFSAAGLPGGIEKHDVFAAVQSEGTWREAASFLLEGTDTLVAVLTTAPGRLALLADARHFTPEASKGEGVTAAVAVTLKATMLPALYPGPWPKGEPVRETGPAGEKAEKRLITYLDAGEVKVNIRDVVYVLKKTKGSGKPPVPYVVTDSSGAVVRNEGALRDALLVARLQAFFTPERVAAIEGVLKEEAVRVETSLDQTCAGGLGPCFAAKSLLGSLEDVRVILGDKASSSKGEVLLAVFSELAWTAGEIVRRGAESQSPTASPAVGAPFDLAKLLGPAPGAKASKAAAPPPDEGEIERLGLQLDVARSQVLKTAAKAGEALGAKDVDVAQEAVFAQGPGRGLLLSTAARFYRAIGYGEVVGEADALISSSVKKAPSPDTSIGKWSQSGATLLVKLSGSDEDGRVTGFKYWLDDPKLPGIIKGASAVKFDLNVIAGGMHVLYAAGIDDDGQQDATPDKFAFYVRRYVNVSVKKVDASFEGSAAGINAEHRRSAVMFAREAEAGVAQCTQDFFRFGIDGKGTIKLSMKFEGKAKASQATKRSVVASSYKNGPLSDCIVKALRSGKLRYNQPYQPAATVSVTYGFEPAVLFFDSKTIADTPGKDATAAVVFTKCTANAARKIEGFCAQAAGHLPGPWDEEKAAEEEKKEGEEEKAGEKTGKKPAPAPEEKKHPEIKFPTVEFDPMLIMAECVKYSMKYQIATCSVGASSKRGWCVDSCEKKAGQCEKTCGKGADAGLDEGQCLRDCWTEFMLPCAENCMLKNTPFEKHK
jgi:hypothetical protein